MPAAASPRNHTQESSLRSQTRRHPNSAELAWVSCRSCRTIPKFLPVCALILLRNILVRAHTSPIFNPGAEVRGGAPSADRLIRCCVLQHGLRQGARLACVIGLQASTGTAAQRQPPAVPRRCYHRRLPGHRCLPAWIAERLPLLSHAERELLGTSSQDGFPAGSFVQ